MQLLPTLITLLPTIFRVFCLACTFVSSFGQGLIVAHYYTSQGRFSWRPPDPDESRKLQIPPYHFKKNAALTGCVAGDSGVSMRCSFPQLFISRLNYCLDAKSKRSAGLLAFQSLNSIIEIERLFKLYFHFYFAELNIDAISSKVCRKHHRFTSVALRSTPENFKDQIKYQLV